MANQKPHTPHYQRLRRRAARIRAKGVDPAEVEKLVKEKLQ